MIIANTGTAPLESVKLAGTAPTGWEVSFDPAEIAAVQPGETAQVAAVIKPASDAVAGDYIDDRARQRRQPGSSSTTCATRSRDRARSASWPSA